MSGKHGRRLPGRRSAPAPRRASGSSPPGPAAGNSGSPRKPPAGLAGSRAIFRKEALEFHARGHDPEGRVIRLGAPWLKRSYRATVALVAAGVAAAVLIQVHQSSYGAAVIDPARGRFAALFPVAVAPDLGTARGLSFGLPGAGLRLVRVSAVHVKLARGSTASRAGLARPDQPSVLLTGRLVTSVRTRAVSPFRTDAVVIMPSRSLAAMLSHEFSVMLGEGIAGS